MGLQKKENTLPKPLQELSQSGLAVNLINGNFALNQPPKTLAEAVKKGQPISVVAKVTDMEAIYNQIEFDLIKSMALLNLNLTIKEHQYQSIVRELVETFPNESIEDFQLCFKNGVTGKYGKIYNVDLSVLATWMGEYLDEKYQYMESHKEPEAKEPLPDVDYEAFKQRKQMKAETTDLQAERASQLKKMAYTPPSKEYIIQTELKREWGRLFHDPITGNKKDNWVPFEDWQKL